MSRAELLAIARDLQARCADYHVIDESQDIGLVNYGDAGVWLVKFDGVSIDGGERLELIAMPSTTTAAQWFADFVRRARVCRIDACQAARVGRADIARQLRQSARDYLDCARFAARKIS